MGIIIYNNWNYSSDFSAIDNLEFQASLYRPAGMGVTKPISSVPLFSEFFNNAKTHVDYWISGLYLAGVAAAQLRWHLSNINMIQII